MEKCVALIAGTCLGLWLASPAYAQRPEAAQWDSRPGFDFHPQSTADAPCGLGTPPRGHLAPEVTPAGLPDGLTLTVRQDAHRLCYVFGNIPEAPVIRVRRGQDLTITLRNEITDPAAIGNTVAIATLDEPVKPLPAQAGYYPVIGGMHHAASGATNLHLHGFPIPPVPPQDEVLTTCVDPAVGPPLCGRREFTYHYKVPADMPAGLYWYHPHVHGEVQAQMLMGLSGAIVVEGPEDDARRAAGIQDRFFVVRQSQDLDQKDPAAGAALAIPPLQPTSREPAAANAAGKAGGQMPFEGQKIDTAHELGCTVTAGTDEITFNASKVVDGDPSDGELANLQIAQNTTQLWRVLNAATDAYLDLALVDEDDHPMPITLVARDGAPLTDDTGRRVGGQPTTVSQLVPPAGRLEFLIQAPPIGAKLYLVTHAVDTGCAGDRVPERKLALVTALPTATATVAADTKSGAPPPAFQPPGAAPDIFSQLIARKTDRRRVIALAEYPRPGADDQTDFYIMERRPGAVLRPFTMTAPPAITVQAGAVEEWEVENWTNELHAFHIHQVHFRVLAVNGKDLADPPLLDVVNVPFATHTDGGVVPGRVRVKLWFPESLAGDIPFHCHLVDHEDNGMMAVLRVVPRKADARKAALTPVVPVGSGSLGGSRICGSGLPAAPPVPDAARARQAASAIPAFAAVLTLAGVFAGTVGGIGLARRSARAQRRQISGPDAPSR